MEGKRTPFFSFLMTCATVKEKGCDWPPAAVVAGSTLLKSRNMHMNVTPSLISVMIRQSGTQVFVNDILVLIVVIILGTFLAILHWPIYPLNLCYPNGGQGVGWFNFFYLKNGRINRGGLINFQKSTPTNL